MPSEPIRSVRRMRYSDIDVILSTFFVSITGGFYCSVVKKLFFNHQSIQSTEAKASDAYITSSFCSSKHLFAYRKREMTTVQFVRLLDNHCQRCLYVNGGRKRGSVGEEALFSNVSGEGGSISGNTVLH